MYHSKNGGSAIALPHNYSGSAFTFLEDEDTALQDKVIEETFETEEQRAPQKPCENTVQNSLFGGISTEDLLLLGLILVIKDSNQNDSTLLLLLILLLTK